MGCISSRLKDQESLPLDSIGEPWRLSLEDLRKITDDFSSERLLGQGGFGKVYKGALDDGRTIAVKVLTSTIPENQKREFVNEAGHLIRLRHLNIVRLVGYCSEKENIEMQYNGKMVRAEKLVKILCLEYMCKGSLRDHLSDESSGLDWDTRYKIIKGICDGLHYLHEDYSKAGPIIHMDLTPENILLNDDMVPKITDFGISRLFNLTPGHILLNDDMVPKSTELNMSWLFGQTHTYTKNCKGKLGYMAPEYIDKGTVSKELDVFSFGVIIIEIITGRRDYPDETGTSSAEYLEHVLGNWKNRIRIEVGHTSKESLYKQIRHCIIIGLLCVQRDRKKRPTTRQIIKMLHGLLPEDLRQTVTRIEGGGDVPTPGYTLPGWRLAGH